MFFTGVNVTKQLGFSQFNVACKWKRKYRRHQTDEGWFLLTNLSTLQAAINVYQQRSGIECMFRDCKSGGYNLEGCYAIETRLSAVVLLIAIAYTTAIIQGIDIRTSKIECYICRPKEQVRIQRRHSNFWVGLYAQTWLNNLEFCIDWVGKWMRNNCCGAALLSTGLTSHRLYSAYFLAFLSPHQVFINKHSIYKLDTNFYQLSPIFTEFFQDIGKATFPNPSMNWGRFKLPHLTHLLVQKHISNAYIVWIAGYIFSRKFPRQKIKPQLLRDLSDISPHNMKRNCVRLKKGLRSGKVVTMTSRIVRYGL